MITLKQYTNEEAQIIPLIQGFWKAHSHYDQSEAEALEDLQNWTKPGHMIYFIQNDAVMWALPIWEAAAVKWTGWKICSSCRNGRATVLAAKRFTSWKKS